MESRLLIRNARAIVSCDANDRLWRDADILVEGQAIRAIGPELASTQAALVSGAQVVGPVPLPTKKKVIVVTSSPHTDKDAREQFAILTHKRLIDIVNPTNKTIDSLQHLDLPAGVGIEIKM